MSTYTGYSTAGAPVSSIVPRARDRRPLSFAISPARQVVPRDPQRTGEDETSETGRSRGPPRVGHVCAAACRTASCLEPTGRGLSATCFVSRPPFIIRPSPSCVPRPGISCHTFCCRPDRVRGGRPSISRVGSLALPALSPCLDAASGVANSQPSSWSTSMEGVLTTPPDRGILGRAQWKVCHLDSLLAACRASCDAVAPRADLQTSSDMFASAVLPRPGRGSSLCRAPRHYRIPQWCRAPSRDLSTPSFSPSIAPRYDPSRDLARRELT